MAAPVWAAFGSTTGLLLSQPLAVRPLGMAGAFAATADDESSISSNPAGLARVQGMSFEGGQLIGLLGLEVSHLSFAANLTPGLGLGLQSAYLYDSDTTRDAFGNEGGSFNNSNLLGALALGFQVLPGWRLGAGIKGLEENYGGSTAASLAADLGVQGPVWHSVRFGAVLQNMGASLNGLGNLPLQMQGGVSFPFFIDSWRVDLEAQGLPSQGQLRALAGTELKLDLGSSDTGLPLQAAFRAGLASPLIEGESARVSLGAGLTLAPTYEVNYALVSVGDVGATNQLSLSFHFPGAAPPPPTAANLSAPYGLKISDDRDGVILSWSDSNEHVAGYNIHVEYDKGIIAEKLNSKPITKTYQKFVKVERGRTYKFTVRPIGADDKEGPVSDPLTYRHP